MEEYPTLEYLANLSNQIFDDVVEFAGARLKIKTRAPTIADLDHVDQLAGKNSYRYAVFLIMRCLINPKPTSQLEIEGWNAGLVKEIVKKIQSHAQIGLEDKSFLKESLEVQDQKHTFP